MLFTNEGLLLICDYDGVIKKIHFNSFNSSIENSEGKLFIDILMPESLNKGLDFLVDIKINSASFGCELKIKDNNKGLSAYFSGAVIEKNFTIFGSLTKVDFEKFITGMMLINNEQTNAIRALEKEQHLLSQKNQNTSSYYFDELSRLNNELVSMQRELSKKNMELAELNNIKNQFLGMAAHDLRNPLAIIINYSEFIEEEGENLSKDQLEFISQIKSSTKFMLNLVTDLLDVTAIEAGKINLNLESVDLITLLKNIIALNKPLAVKKIINILFTSSENSITLLLDRGKIEQVITNLITNAIKYSYSKTEILVELKKTDSEVIISVKDQGQGIEEKEINLLFKPFQKTSVKSTAGEKSTGLGLYIVKRIVDGHKGRIWVESEKGKGSTFSVSLPITI